MTAQAVHGSAVPGILFLAFLMATSASATTECSVKQAPGGFVAIHEQPSSEAKVVGQLKPKDVVLISHEHDPVGPWIYVARKERGGGYGVSGWVLDRFISKDECG